ncbi:MAG: PQQ-binding-like beta-propeller repeat protein [Candidatus Lokiarchaeota archaeon]|nr:PQQ-binding-like beta-propeller repeat protein [Candidatus Lokiarchaeota archaeon]
MRGDMKNSGRFPLDSWENPGINPKAIHFRTGNAIFSTPIIGELERIFVGSADHKFYAFDPHEEIKEWSDEVGEIIDSAGCIDKDGTIYVAAGDSKIHAYTSNGKKKFSYDNLKNRVKQQFTFSTNYWYEANIVIGPDGYLYVANDDFFIYKFSRDGKPIWGFRTGFFIWAAPAFSDEGLVYVPGFDHIFYALDMKTGKLIWKKDLKGSLVSSPAVDKDGIIYQGAFNGKMYALDGNTDGEIIWELDTGGHIYASAAIGSDNTIYFGSTSGYFYALESKTGKIKWKYYIGDAIRSSASIGPDPEGIKNYLIYFGGGNGLIYALEPEGNIRWAYNTLEKALNTDYPNINASIALGENGLAAASSTGDVIWLSYDYYKKGDAVGILSPEEILSKHEGIYWHYISTGGKLNRKPLEKQLQVIDPTTIISIKLLIHENGRLFPVELDPSSIKIASKPYFDLRFELQSDMTTLNIIHDNILEPNTEYSIKISSYYYNRDENKNLKESTIRFITKKAPKDSSILTEGATYKITNMATPQPTIIPSLDQIGLSSLTIPFSIVETDVKQGTFIAFAVQKFGEEGVPQQRISKYAFSGKVKNDFFMMDSKNCMFEITSFAIPLDLFRISGLLKNGTVEPGGSLLIEKYIGSNTISILRTLASNYPMDPKELLDLLRQGGIIEFIKALRSFVPSLLRQFSRGMWETWGLLNHNEKIVGVGTFRLSTIPNEKDQIISGIEIYKFHRQSKRKIVAELKIPKREGPFETTACIILINTSSNEVIPINYNNKIAYKNRSEKQKVILNIPKSIKITPGKFRAYLMIDIYPIKKIDF